MTKKRSLEARQFDTLIKENKVQDVVNSIADNRKALNDLIAYSQSLNDAAKEKLADYKSSSKQCFVCNGKAVTGNCSTCKEALCSKCSIQCEDCDDTTCKKCCGICCGDNPSAYDKNFNKIPGHKSRYSYESDGCGKKLCSACVVSTECEREVDFCEDCLNEYDCADCDVCQGYC